MIGLSELVAVVIGLLIGGVVIALLWFLIGYCEKEIGGPPMIYKVIRVVFVIIVVLILISILLHMAGMPVVQVR